MRKRLVGLWETGPGAIIRAAPGVPRGDYRKPEVDLT